MVRGYPVAAGNFSDLEAGFAAVPFVCETMIIANVFFAMPLLFEMFLFALTLTTALREKRARIRTGFRIQSFIDVFIRDGTWAFAIIFCE